MFISFAPRPDRAFYFNVPIDVSVSRLVSGRAKLKDYEAGMDLGLATDLVSSFKIFQGRILGEYARITNEYGLTEIDATQSIGEQQQIVREASSIKRWKITGPFRQPANHLKDLPQW